ncbi:hypothetical protein SISSUDRAFT_710138 [Sistotremastrum suecicum HHB10207 ss-3]|uniref:HNH nuclease domain-containing protein n=1 Tax=Sistotremastrum suecicum HHB10207 ss-3 TaxID=1314776 RepID=A0A166DRD3_9AGAM|nr:hypothetical protein SISSUDRAFT_710138 [Sistotremastrum suecicum HHB10207 ss-3]
MATTPAGPSMETAHEFEEDDSDDEFDELIDHYYERRNILILNAQDSIIAGLEQRGTFFVRNVYRWLKTLYLLPEDDGWFIRCLSDGQIVPCNSHILFPIGSFHIVSKDSLVLSPSRKITHPLYRCLVNLDHSRPTYLDEDVFQEICRRDQRCLITGWNLPDPRRQFKDDFFCARIFPLMPPSRFADPLVQELLPGSAESAEAFAQLMQSPSNAFICSYMPCEVFNAYWFSIDVDDDYRIVQFVDCQNWNVPVSGSGKLLVDSWSEHATRPSDALLRAHFQQALLRWLHNDPAEHQEYLTATKLAFRIQDQEITSGDSAWIQEPGSQNAPSLPLSHCT